MDLAKIGSKEELLSRFVYSLGCLCKISYQLHNTLCTIPMKENPI